jgi:hypothetical protein
VILGRRFPPQWVQPDHPGVGRKMSSVPPKMKNHRQGIASGFLEV